MTHELLIQEVNFFARIGINPRMRRKILRYCDTYQISHGYLPLALRLHLEVYYKDVLSEIWELDATPAQIWRLYNYLYAFDKPHCEMMLKLLSVV